MILKPDKKYSYSHDEFTYTWFFSETGLVILSTCWKCQQSLLRAMTAHGNIFFEHKFDMFLEPETDLIQSLLSAIWYEDDEYLKNFKELSPDYIKALYKIKDDYEVEDD